MAMTLHLLSIFCILYVGQLYMHACVHAHVPAYIDCMMELESDFLAATNDIGSSMQEANVSKFIKKLWQCEFDHQN